MNRAEKAVSKVDKRLGIIYEKIYKDVARFDLLNGSPEETQARIKAAVDKQAPAIAAVIDGTIGTAIGVSPLADVVREKYVTGKLSTLYDKKGITKLITESVEKSVSTYRNYGQAGRELRGIMSRAVDPYKAVAKLQKRAREVLRNATTDAEKRKALNVIAKTKKLLARDDLTKLMGKKLGEETLSQLPKQLSTALNKAITEDAKMRSTRIVRTEYAKAYGDTQLSEAVADDRVVAVKFSLNSSHEIYDICNFHTEADLYGLGAGIYPTEQQPEYPFHPNCMCAVDHVYIGEVDPQAEKDFSRKDGDKFLSELSTNRREELMGVTGNKLYEEGAKWESVLQNYNGQSKFVPVTK